MAPIAAPERTTMDPAMTQPMSDAKFRVLLLDTKYRNPNHYICLAIFAALKRHPSVESVVHADPLDAVHLAIEQRCDLFIAFDGEELDVPLCARLAAICGRSVLWVTEDPYELDTNLRHAALFDVVFTNDSSSVAAYGERGAHLPLAGATDFHSLPVRTDAPLRYDLFFAGTAWPNRSQFIRSVLSKMPADWKTKLALPSNPFLPPHGVPLPQSSLAWRTSPADFARFVNQSAITLLLPRVFSASGGREYAETPPPRLFEAALAGGAQMVHESLEEVVHSFTPGKEIVVFSSDEDFIAKATSLIDHPSERNAIAEAARQRGLRDHTYDRRADTIVRRAQQIAARKPAAAVAASGATRSPRTLLFVAHNVLGRGHFGGVEVYLDRLRKSLTPDWRILFYVPGDGASQTHTLLLDADYAELKRYSFGQRYAPSLLSCPERERSFHALLLEQRVDVVHFHHLIGHPPSLPMIARHAGARTLFTAHDYYAVCHEFNLLSYRDQFCGAPNVSLSQCDVCLHSKHRIAPGSQAQRRMFWNEMLRNLDVLVFNTAGAQQTFAAMYPAVREHPRVELLPVPIADGAPRLRAHRDGPRQGPLKIALLGNVTLQKGGELLERVLPLLQRNDVEIHVFGRIDPVYVRAIKPERIANLIVHGPYSADALPDALLACDVSLHLSIWPETYCLTLSEAWQYGLVPIVSDIGALSERVEHGVNGIKIDVEAGGQLIDAIRLLIDDPAWLDHLRRGVAGHLYAQLGPHMQAAAAMYTALATGPASTPPSPALSAALSGDSAAPHHRSLAELGVLLQSPSWHDGAGQSPRGGAGSLVLKARRLAAFYRRTGIRTTLQLVSNKVRARL